MKKKFPLLAVLFLSFAVLYSFVDLKKDEGHVIVENPAFENLQVLPKDIPAEALENIMKGFNEALGVKCSHCHVVISEENWEMDFATDEKMAKNIARGMMRMTMDINQKYFEIDDPSQMAVNCFTCHHGEKTPALAPPVVEETE